ncbi:MULTISPECIES: excinuclease [Pseudomonas]|uniref:excinuclease n=1 Tax=Pseudomonas TaxID=286 RepID=UPI001C80F243|nr:MULTISPECIES: excinuclease [Pseudomonas]MDG9926689.1 excinuclease [Pseudomonas sp. GD04042]MDH0482242.1 excinuclease [Pseudomonas sp. GD04015]MDH0603677.1 excinuclease [Pseudomonas sp. GD03869]
MKNKYWIIAALCLSVLPSVSQARDTTHFLPFDQVVQEALNAGRLDGSVKFYLAGNPVKASVVKSGVTTHQKTNAFNKSDEAACSWALQSALIRMQNAAKQAGANAVVNIVSNYKNVVYSDAQKYECHAGAVVAGVALKADLANVK